MNVVVTDSEAETAALGARLGMRLRAGMAVALVGELGAGKSAFSRGIAEGLGVVGRVRSPTYVLAARYDSGRLPLVHADLYRLADASELAGLDLLAAQEQGAIVVVEWAERFPEVLPLDHLLVAIELGEGDARRIALSAGGPVHAALLEDLGG